MHPVYTQLIAMVAAVVAGVTFAHEFERPLRRVLDIARARLKP